MRNVVLSCILAAVLFLPAACQDLPGSLRSGKGTTAAPAGGCLTRDCHRAVLTAAYLHTPARDGQCDICHVQVLSDHPGGDGWEFRRVMGAEEHPCFDCHHDYQARPLNVHNPWRLGHCMECHEPHGSELPALVKRDVNGLCLYCHRNLAARLERARIRHGDAEETCVTTCHSPHWSEKRRLLQENEETLCVSCHGTAAECLTPRGSGAAACTGCHFPHGSLLPKMLKENNFLYRNRP